MWVPETRHMSCDVLVFVKESAEPVVSSDVAGVGVGLAMFGERRKRSGLCQCAVRTMVVEVVLVLGRDRGHVVLVGDEDRVEEFAADAADESFGGRVRSWGWDWCSDHVYPGGRGYSVNVAVDFAPGSRMGNRNCLQASSSSIAR
ncbi:MAG: hypothetical protein QOG20_5946 [Pseudonocardiales bacterium]|nr:hypothetical protein [Pseudonocardiales bacterium]